MIQGHVNEALEPIVEIGLRRGEVIVTIPTIVDTGFSGYLCLSERHVDEMTMAFHHVEHYELANGDVIPNDVFRGMIRFDGQDQEVDVILTASDDTLIGASLFRGYKVAIDYARCRVRIER